MLGKDGQKKKKTPSCDDDICPYVLGWPWAGSGFALQSSGCCWWTGLFCNQCVGCVDSLAEGNL